MRQSKLVLTLLFWGCRPSSPPAPPLPKAEPALAATPQGIQVTREEVAQQLGRLPPLLREQFESPAGQKELADSMLDKRLMAQESRRRGFAADPEVRRQLLELEERLIVQKLLADEEQKAGPMSEADLRGYYDTHRAEFALPERVRASRVLISVPASASQADRAKARARMDGLLGRLKKGESFSRVARDGDGPERVRGGDLGTLGRSEFRDEALASAAFALKQPGAHSGVVTTPEGLAVLELVEHQPPRTPPFEEVRGQVANRLDPVRKRKSFDALRARLRQEQGSRPEQLATH